MKSCTYNPERYILIRCDDLKLLLYIRSVRFSSEEKNLENDSIDPDSHPFDVVGGSRKACYAYFSVFDETDKIMGVAKYDLRMEPSSTVSRELKVGGNLVGVFHYGPGRAGSEAIFVPRKPGMDGPEGDGYLISFVHDENTE